MGMGGDCWVLEVDIKSYFDTGEVGALREFYKERVRDRGSEPGLGQNG